jgi:hypothetical protein
VGVKWCVGVKEGYGQRLVTGVWFEGEGVTTG